MKIMKKILAHAKRFLKRIDDFIVPVPENSIPEYPQIKIKTIKDPDKKDPEGKYTLICATILPDDFPEENGPQEIRIPVNSEEIKSLSCGQVIWAKYIDILSSSTDTVDRYKKATDFQMQQLLSHSQKPENFMLFYLASEKEARDSEQQRRERQTRQQQEIAQIRLLEKNEKRRRRKSSVVV